MCRVEIADIAQVSTVQVHITRKDRACTECARTIKVGERYERCTGLWEKSWETYRTCAHCMAARAWLLRECGGWIYTEVCEELVEHWEEDWVYRTFWLARVIAGMRHRWHDGRLPVPDEPPVVAA